MTFCSHWLSVPSGVCSCAASANWKHCRQRDSVHLHLHCTLAPRTPSTHLAATAPVCVRSRPTCARSRRPAKRNGCTVGRPRIERGSTRGASLCVRYCHSTSVRGPVATGTGASAICRGHGRPATMAPSTRWTRHPIWRRGMPRIGALYSLEVEQRQGSLLQRVSPVRVRHEDGRVSRLRSFQLCGAPRKRHAIDPPDLKGSSPSSSVPRTPSRSDLRGLCERASCMTRLEIERLPSDKMPRSAEEGMVFPDT